MVEYSVIVEISNLNKVKERYTKDLLQMWNISYLYDYCYYCYLSKKKKIIVISVVVDSI